MTTRYVGIGGNDANNGLSWATRKLTLNGIEDTPVEAGDTVYIGPGTYREMLTCDVSGSAGNPITYIGDYKGTNTDGVGGVVRITGSDDDRVEARTEVIIINGKNYRTFQGFVLDGASTELILISGGADNFTIKDCYFGRSGADQIEINPVADGGTFLIDGCYFAPNPNTSIYMTAAAAVVSNGVISNCINDNRQANFNIRIDNTGGIIIKNCLFNSYVGVRVLAAHAGTNPIIVNNCIFKSLYSALYAPSTDQITEDYNCFSGVAIARTNVNIGANSNTYFMLPDTRWFFEMVGGGSLITMLDLSSESQLINVAGTSPTTADIRGTTVIGANREWGVLEYDPDLDIEAGTGGGGSVKINPLFGRVGL